MNTAMIADWIKGTHLPKVDDTVWNDSTEEAAETILTNPRIDQFLKATFNHSWVGPGRHVYNTAVGSAAGAAAGLLLTAIAKAKPNEHKHWLRNMLLGAAGGGAAGYYGPKVIQWLVGRVVTNIIPPYGNDPTIRNEIYKNAGTDKDGKFNPMLLKKRMLVSIIKDEPLYMKYIPEGSEGVESKDRDFDTGKIMTYRKSADELRQWYTMRNMIYRGGFGLPTNIKGAGDYWTVQNPEQSHAGGVGEDPLLLSPNPAQPFAFSRIEALSNTTEAERAKVGPGKSVVGAGLMGSTGVRPDDTYADPLDYDVHKGEPLNRPSTLMRLMVTPWVNPAVAMGKVMPKEKLESWNLLHHPEILMKERKKTKDYITKSEDIVSRYGQQVKEQEDTITTLRDKLREIDEEKQRQESMRILRESSSTDIPDSSSRYDLENIIDIPKP